MKLATLKLVGKMQDALSLEVLPLAQCHMIGRKPSAFGFFLEDEIFAHMSNIQTFLGIPKVLVSVLTCLTGLTKNIHRYLIIVPSSSSAQNEQIKHQILFLSGEVKNWITHPVLEATQGIGFCLTHLTPLIGSNCFTWQGVTKNSDGDLNQYKVLRGSYNL